MEERFGYLKSIGISNVAELQKLLKKKAKFDELSKLPGFSADYLTILLREINSNHPKPNKLRDLTGISPDTVSKLEKLGITDTFKLYARVVTIAKRSELVRITEIKESEILELAYLSDLSRIKWAGASFVRMLYDTGYTSVAKVAKADYVQMHQQINQLNRDKNLYKGAIGLNDIKIFIQAAADVPVEVEGIE